MHEIQTEQNMQQAGFQLGTAAIGYLMARKISPKAGGVKMILLSGVLSFVVGEVALKLWPKLKPKLMRWLEGKKQTDELRFKGET